MFRQSWACALRVDRLVATVMYTPSPLMFRSSYERPGFEALVDGHLVDTIPWSKLPMLSHFQHGGIVVPHPDGPLEGWDYDPEFPDVRGALEFREFQVVQARVMGNLLDVPTKRYDAWNSTSALGQGAVPPVE